MTIVWVTQSVRVCRVKSNLQEISMWTDHPARSQPCARATVDEAKSGHKPSASTQGQGIALPCT